MINSRSLLVLGIYLAIGICLLGFFSKVHADVREDVKSTVKEYIMKQKADWADGKIVVSINGGDKFFKKHESAGKVKFGVPDTYRITKVTPIMILPIAAISEGREIDRAMLSVRIEVFKDVAVAGKKIGKKEIIDEDNVALENREISLYPARYFTDLDRVVGKVAISTVQKGSMIQDWMIKDLPVVAKGSRVKIVVRSENLLIESVGYALADGQLNDPIRVRRLDSREEFEAQVVSKDAVEVKI